MSAISKQVRSSFNSPADKRKWFTFTYIQINTVKINTRRSNSKKSHAGHLGVFFTPKKKSL